MSLYPAACCQSSQSSPTYSSPAALKDSLSVRPLRICTSLGPYRKHSYLKSMPAADQVKCCFTIWYFAAADCLLGPTLKEYVKNPPVFGEDENKSLELNFWPILYDSIVFLCLQTPEVYLKLTRKPS